MGKRDFDVLPYTPQTRMVFRAIARKAVDWYLILAAEREIDPRLLDETITDYAMLCARVTNLNGQVDFPVTTMQDTSDQMLENFKRYLDSRSMGKIRDLEQRMLKMDAPQDEDKAPGATPVGEG